MSEAEQALERAEALSTMVELDVEAVDVSIEELEGA